MRIFLLLSVFFVFASIVSLNADELNQETDTLLDEIDKWQM